MDTAAPSGFFRNAHCNKMNNYICEIVENAVFIETEGSFPNISSFITSGSYKYIIVISDKYISSTNHPFNYPNVNDQVHVTTTASIVNVHNHFNFQ